eukprot:gene14809-4393_t
MHRLEVIIQEVIIQEVIIHIPITLHLDRLRGPLPGPITLHNMVIPTTLPAPLRLALPAMPQTRHRDTNGEEILIRIKEINHDHRNMLQHLAKYILAHTILPLRGSHLRDSRKPITNLAARGKEAHENFDQWCHE